MKFIVEDMAPLYRIGSSEGEEFQSIQSLNSCSTPGVDAASRRHYESQSRQRRKKRGGFDASRICSLGAGRAL